MQKGIIQIPILIAIITSTLALGAVGYIALGKYRDVQKEKVRIEAERQNMLKEKDAATQSLIKEQQKALEDTQKEVEALKKTQQAQKIIAPKSPQGIVDIVNTWRKRVVSIECDKIQGGSGTLMKFNGSDTINVITNGHVILIDEQLPYNCIVRLPFEKIGTGYDLSIWGNTIITSSGYDLATIPLKIPNDYTKQNTPSQNAICKERPTIGDSVVILGYPGIGSFEDITVTEGIISGYDGEYYVTSAKVEHGNSGGAAILVKNNCYLGIPTLSLRGKLESLARILDANIALGFSGGPDIESAKTSGTIAVRNDSQTDQKIVKFTRFIASNGLIYRAQESVTVPAQGASQVMILSDGNGDEYKLSCSTPKPCTLKIPAFEGTEKYELIYGQATVPIK